MAPLGAQAADLVVWWEEGQAAEEDEAVREIIAAFEQDSGKQVELVLGPQEELVADLAAALEAGRDPPDLFFTVVETQPYEQWAYEGRLVDLTDAVGHFSDLFDRDALERVTLLDGTTGRRGLYAAADGARDPPRPRLEEPARARRLHPRGHSEGVGSLLGLLVRSGASLPYARRWAATTSGAIGLPMAAASIDTIENGIWHELIHAHADGVRI